MMKKLIICEKPSLAKSVCGALAILGEKLHRKDGYIESDNYCIVPAFGHLFVLCDIEEYRLDYSLDVKYRWTLDNLPFVPENNVFKFKIKPDSTNNKTPDSGVKKQYEIIKSLIHSNNVNSIINCGDSDREGEIIVRLILSQAGNTKPVYRLWLPDQVEETIIKSLSEMKSDSTYDALADEGYARMFADWLYGINLTRYASIKYGALQRVGRVIGAITKAICDRDRAIRAFQPETYYVAASKVETNGKLIALISKIRYTLNEKESVEMACAEYNKQKTQVIDKTIAKKIVGSPKLFSQSTLQNYLSKKYGYSPDVTLKLVQSLYEAGYVSYPRTPTEYLATAEKDKAKAIISAINKKYEIPLLFKDKKTIFDDSKIESHSAITPTIKIPDNNAFKSVDEENCYKSIFNRFCAVFYSDDCIIEQTKIIIAVGSKEEFTLTGNVPIQDGWKAIDKPDKEDKEEDTNELPILAVGDIVNTDFAPLERQTTPPKHFTVETLNNYLKNPFRNELKKTDGDDDDYHNMLAGLEIGTEATRPGIIANAINSGYFTLSKSTYTIEPAGEKLVDNMALLGIDMSKEKTALMGKAIRDVYKRDKNIQDVIFSVKQELESIVSADSTIAKYERPAPSEAEILGNCPRCGQPVTENIKAFGCTARCGFTLWKNNAFLESSKKKLTKTIVRSLLSKGQAKVSGLTSKSGKKYDCTIALEDTGKYVNIKPIFGGNK